MPGGPSRDSNDAADYPIPDLAVEVDISPPQIDRPGIYSTLRVPEVWRFSGDVVSIEQLDATGNYVAADVSQFLHVRADEVTQWLRDGRSGEWLSWKRRRGLGSRRAETAGRAMTTRRINRRGRPGA